MAALWYHQDMYRYIVISMGEAAGTSPEMILKAVNALSATFSGGVIVTGDEGVFSHTASDLSIDPCFSYIAENEEDLRAAEENGEIRHFALHRFEDASMINTPANKPVGFELEAYLQNTAFNYTFEPNGGRLIELEFELSNSETVKNLRETPLSRQQTVSELEDGFWRIRAIVRDSCLLDGWLEAWRAIAGIRCITKRVICLESSGSLSETGAQTAKNLCFR